MAVNDAYAKATDALADQSELIIDGSGSGTGAINITELAGTGTTVVYREVDTANNGTWAVSSQIDNPAGTWHSQKNDLLVSQSQNVRIRLKNDSGSTIDIAVFGYEVDD